MNTIEVMLEALKRLVGVMHYKILVEESTPK